MIGDGRMKKILHILTELIVYFIIMLIIESVFVKLGWSDGPIVASAVCITIGWGIWKVICYVIKNKKHSGKSENSCYGRE